MPVTLTRLLIVDDERSIRTSMSVTLTEFGYRVRCAEDGFSALAELRKEIPGILISDLNMPGMSGFELLSVVRRRFPAIQTIAMSGAFSGNEVPSGVAADAFYQKGCSVGSLLRVLETLPGSKRLLPNHAAGQEPIWIQRNGHDLSGEPYVTISCPECLRTFPHTLDGSVCKIREADCIYCRTSIHFAIVEPVTRAVVKALNSIPAKEQPNLGNAAQAYY